MCKPVCAVRFSNFNIYIVTECDPIQSQGSMEWAQQSLLASFWVLLSLVCILFFAWLFCSILLLSSRFVNGFPNVEHTEPEHVQIVASACTCGGKGLKRQYVLDKSWNSGVRLCLCACVYLYVFNNPSYQWFGQSILVSPSTHLTVHRTHSQLVHMTGQVVKDDPLVIADSVMCNKIVAHDWPDGKRQCSDQGKGKCSIIARDSSLAM